MIMDTKFVYDEMFNKFVYKFMNDKKLDDDSRELLFFFANTFIEKLHLNNVTHVESINIFKKSSSNILETKMITETDAKQYYYSGIDSLFASYSIPWTTLYSLKENQRRQMLTVAIDGLVHSIHDKFLEYIYDNTTLTQRDISFQDKGIFGVFDTMLVNELFSVLQSKKIYNGFIIGSNYFTLSLSRIFEKFYGSHFKVVKNDYHTTGLELIGIYEDDQYFLQIYDNNLSPHENKKEEIIIGRFNFDKLNDCFMPSDSLAIYPKMTYHNDNIGIKFLFECKSGINFSQFKEYYVKTRVTYYQ